MGPPLIIEPFFMRDQRVSRPIFLQEQLKNIIFVS